MRTRVAAVLAVVLLAFIGVVAVGSASGCGSDGCAPFGVRAHECSGDQCLTVPHECGGNDCRTATDECGGEQCLAYPCTGGGCVAPGDHVAYPCTGADCAVPDDGAFALDYPCSGDECVLPKQPAA